MSTQTTPTNTAEMAAPASSEQHSDPNIIDVTVRPIEPRGKLIGFASVTFATPGGAVTVPDFKIFNGEKGLFVSNPSRPDASSRSGYRDTARVSGDDLKNKVNVTVRDAYIAEVEKLQSRAAQVVEAFKPRINDQLGKAGQEAARDNAARAGQQMERSVPAHAAR